MRRNDFPGYRLTITRISIEDGETDCYGIEIRDGSEVTKIPDISPDRAKVARMVSLFNEMQLSVKQVFDVIEDMLP